MTDAPYSHNVRLVNSKSDVDPYSAFSDIFGQEPPPGRLPTRDPLATSSPTQQHRHPRAKLPPLQTKNNARANSGPLYSYSPTGDVSSPVHPSSDASHPPYPVDGTPSPYGQKLNSPINMPTAAPPLPAGAAQVQQQANVASNAGMWQSGRGTPSNSLQSSVGGLSLSQRTGSSASLGPLNEVYNSSAHPSAGATARDSAAAGSASRGYGQQPQRTQRSVSTTSNFHMPLSSYRGQDQRAMSLTGTSTTRGGRAIPQRFSDVFGFHNQQQQPSQQPPSTDESPTASARGSTYSAGSTLVGSGPYTGPGAPTRKMSSSTISSMSTVARSAIVTTSRKEPLVYPALLSRVAAKVREKLATGDHIKNELTYKNAFTGNEAVDVVAYIIKTPDRNLALLLGRALDAQKFFHDVTYDNRLRDSPNEVYQFATSATSEGEVGASDSYVNGVFTLLADCYSPTCTRDKLCYSISCPRRLEQQARLNMKLDPGLHTPDSGLSLQEVDEKQKLWINTVSPEIAETVPKEEQKRQEVICELIYTERDFVKDLEYIRDFWIKPLRRLNVIPENRREKFIRTVFLNVLEIHNVNIKFAEALTKRQQLNLVVHQIADVVLEYAPRFEPFIRYGASQLYGKYEFERERAANPAFAKFCEEAERVPEAKKLELNGYLAKPTTRLARYPLLLEAILKRTSPDNPDYTNIPTAVSTIREFLIKVNQESGKAENRFSLLQLNQSLMFRPGEYIDLKLTDEKRQLLYKGEMMRRPTEGPLYAYLFDNALLFVKHKMVNKREVLKVHSKPIPLELLQLAESEEMPRGFRRGPNIIRSNVNRGDIFPLTFQHIGRRGYELTLYGPNFQARKTWVDLITKQQEQQRKQADVYSQHILQSNFFRASLRINCAKTYDGGRKILYGTDQGIYLSDITYEDEQPHCSTPQLVVQSTNVTQVDVLDIYGIILLLSDKTVYSLTLDMLESGDPIANSRRVKHIAQPVNFYKVDECMGRTLLCVVRTHSLSSQIRVLEPADPTRPVSKRPPLRRLLTAGQQQSSEGFKLFKQPVEVPSQMLSICYLRQHLCLGCAKGFELLGLHNMNIESLLDPADTSLDFVIRKDSLRPISIYRLDKEFLLNYSDFSFFINSSGWRSRPNWMIQWESVPQHIVLRYPYLVAFESNFIEIRNMDTELLRAIPGENIRFLQESTHEILYVHENENGFDEVVSMNFWEKQRRVNQVS
ncbi:Rho1 guanine nucleotide exchange factor 1 [Wickerhamiella sorbophila]|uniref:Rho1 guanine nucleotide exchange factor 1 n=1 Tax=Wickerhamiella sorbophila TaxID=45607 RepID=A0A2T0FNQ4_9ASCO|nr:Rho1 guanine nucleotide exchange factor 1 [Wickerhamiella sorbophila]PRT56608.1 Rho1 guanine nucleotide exchange factor 1 [Wickerhamiella sorbophila]